MVNQNKKNNFKLNAKQKTSCCDVGRTLPNKDVTIYQVSSLFVSVSTFEKSFAKNNKNYLDV